MTTFKNWKRLGAVGLFTLVVLAGQTALTAPPKTEKQDGHVSSLVVEITYDNDTVHKGILFGFGNRFNYHTHIIRGFTNENAQADIWLDTIASIEDINGDDATIVLKDESRRELRFDDEKNLLYFSTADGTEERIAISQIKDIKFLTAPRKDRDNNAMFPQWKFSPFTGEKLPRE